MQAPQPNEFLYAFNGMNKELKLCEGYYVSSPSNQFNLRYELADSVILSNEGAIAISTTGVQFTPSLMPVPFGKVDGRKKKMFKFEDYATVYDLASDLTVYLEDILRYHVKVTVKHNSKCPNTWPHT